MLGKLSPPSRGQGEKPDLPSRMALALSQPTCLCLTPSCAAAGGNHQNAWLWLGQLGRKHKVYCFFQHFLTNNPEQIEKLNAFYGYWSVSTGMVRALPSPPPCCGPVLGELLRSPGPHTSTDVSLCFHFSWRRWKLGHRETAAGATSWHG